MFTPVDTCLTMFTRCVLSLLVFNHVYDSLQFHVYLFLPLFTRVYLCLLLFTYVYHSFLVLVFSCLFMFTRIYQFLHFFSNVYPFTLVNTYVYSCLTVCNCILVLPMCNTLLVLVSCPAPSLEEEGSGDTRSFFGT